MSLSLLLGGFRFTFRLLAEFLASFDGLLLSDEVLVGVDPAISFVHFLIQIIDFTCDTFDLVFESDD